MAITPKMEQACRCRRKQMNYQRKLKYYRDLYSFYEYQQIMKLIYNIDTYVNNILEMGLCDDMENALISAFIDQNEVAIQEAMGRLTLFGQDARDNDDKPKECFCEIIEDKDDDKCRCCDRWLECVCIEPGKFYVESFGIIDPNGKLVEENDVPYTDDDEVDLKDDFADDEEDENDEEDEEDKSFADDDEEGFVEEDDEEEDDKDDEEDDKEDDPADDEKDDPVFYLLRKLVRGVNAILKELEL